MRWGKGLLHRSQPPQPLKSPFGRQRRLEWRKHFLIPVAETHGHPGRRPPPAATQLGSQAQEGSGQFPRLPQPGLSPQCSPPQPAKRSPTPLQQCMETSPGPGSREALGFQDSLLQAESIVVGPETGALAADLQELEALSTSLSTSWQSGSKPRSEGARASVLTTTAVTGWPGM